MHNDQLLTSTRSARRTLDLEAEVDLAEVSRCLEIGLHAANGTNQQSWRWLIIRDPDRRAVIADLYRDSYLAMTGGRVADLIGTDTGFGRVMASTEWLVDHLGEVPLLVLPCYQPYIARNETNEHFATATLYGSVFPAVWNFQLALRSRGYGSCITTLHLERAAETAELLGIPDGYVQTCLLPVGRLRPQELRPSPRKSLSEVTALDAWDGPPLEGTDHG